MTSLLVTWYGDDSTGSTDVLEALTNAGLRSVLFLAPPSPGDLARFPGVQAVGVAGMSRTMSPAEMDAELPVAFERLAALGAPVCHYKICSTFDSSPMVGSIGHAIDLGQKVLRAAFVPVVVGAPRLRRYSLFGNLFASVGTETFRLDRHPTMSRHPITPMYESDLRVHLAKQTARPIGLVDILALAGTPDEVDARLAAVRAAGAEIVLFDVLDDARLAEVGRLIWTAAKRAPVFTASSSGLEYALCAHWRTAAGGNLVPVEPPAQKGAGPVDQIAVVSGSCSPVTQTQIDAALAAGFAGVEVDSPALLDPARRERARATAVLAAKVELARGRSVLLHSARGPEDARIRAAEEVWRRSNPHAAAGAGRALGEELGHLARAVLEAHPLRRMVLAGGDTSGHGARRLGIEALEMIAPVAPGSPLCRASSHDAKVDGLEIVLKGGQVGKTEYFENVRLGKF